MGLLESGWIQTQFVPGEPGFWLLVSFLASAAVAWVGRTLTPPNQRRLYVVRWILVPYLGLIGGALSPRLLGLAYLDLAAALRLGVPFIGSVLVLLLFVRSTLQDPEAGQVSDEPATQSSVEQFVWAGAQEFHWSFLRGAVWEILISAPTPPALPGYWAIWIATGLAIPGIFRQYRRNSQRIIAGMVLVLTAILFFYIRNFWLGWLLHAGAQFILGQREALHQKTKHNHGYE